MEWAECQIRMPQMMATKSCADEVRFIAGEDTSEQPAVTVAANDEDIELTDVADEEEAAQAIQAADPDGDIELQANPVPVSASSHTCDILATPRCAPLPQQVAAVMHHTMTSATTTWQMGNATMHCAPCLQALDKSVLMRCMHACRKACMVLPSLLQVVKHQELWNASRGESSDTISAMVSHHGIWFVLTSLLSIR